MAASLYLRLLLMPCSYLTHLLYAHEQDTYLSLSP